MKIISSKKYYELQEIEEKYSRLIGETITLSNGETTEIGRLLKLSKEELVSRLLSLDVIVRIERNLKEVI